MGFPGFPVLVYLGCGVFVFVSLVHSSPVKDQYSRGVDWLSRYGYLPAPDPRTGLLQSKAGIEQAIKEMQRFAGLRETGNLDSETLQLMNTPRCSLPDIISSADMLKKRRRKRRYATTGLRWKKSELTWSLQNYPSLSPFLKPTAVETLMAYALKAWSDVTNLKFHPSSRGDEDRADIRISFARSLHDDGYPFDGKGGTLAHAFFPGDSDCEFDDSGTDLFAVAVHEFGHALGLSHSSSLPSIMRPYYQGAVGNVDLYSLPEDDREAIQSIYAVLKEDKLNPIAKYPNISPSQTTEPSSSSQSASSVSPYFWRIQRSGSLVSLRPALIKNFWIGLPPGTERIDAIYERKADSRIIFFIGSQYWAFKDTVALSGYPRPLSDWGLVTSDGRKVSRVDAAFVWAHNGKTYIFSAGEFWRFSEAPQTDMQRPDAGYPRNSALWKGAPSTPDDVITWGDGDAYFFKNNSYWILKSGGLDQDTVSHRSTALDWMMCPEATPTKSAEDPQRRRKDERCVCNGASPTGASAWMLFFSTFLLHAGFRRLGLLVF
ncbi:hypothetical protein DNTS_007593 [Danionella cerebrum]|uniref:Peptidase metallopeptidase domain-containing protein n=1 Tax=Danionella cerebrum TaxID=2873325 RepID=A0A553PYD3_9TELE|nr:hypothetical protein DNTS_007593 [Danionella translucida]